MMTQFIWQGHTLLPVWLAVPNQPNWYFDTFITALVPHTKDIAKGGRLDEVVCDGPMKPSILENVHDVKRCFRQGRGGGVEIFSFLIVGNSENHNF